MVIQAYAPISNAVEAEVERFYEDLQDLLELTPKKDVLEMATHSIILVWKISWMEKPGRPQSMGSQRVGHY